MRTIIAGSLLLLSVAIVIAGGGAPRKEDMPKYIKTINTASATPAAKREAAEMIGKRGQISLPDVKAAIDPLRKLAKEDKDDGVRKSVVIALGAIAPEPETTVPLLIDVLKHDKSQEVKFATVAALGRFGPKATSALPGINDFAKDLDKKQKQQLIQPAVQAIRANK